MERINKFYDIGEISDIMRLDVKSVNQLFIVNVAHNKYLLKIYIPRFYKTALLSLTAQELVSENLRMAPRVIYNKKIACFQWIIINFFHYRNILMDRSLF